MKTQSNRNLRFQIQKPIWTFTGRLDFLANLHQKLKECTTNNKTTKSDPTQTPLLVLAAPPGIGKTETARMYIQKYGQEYNHIVWIDAGNQSSAQAQFRVKLAAELRVRTEFRGRPKPFETIVKEIYMKMCQSEKGEVRSVLIIFDNADSLKDDSKSPITGIQAYLPPRSCQDDHFKFAILVTSRNKNWHHPLTTMLLCYPWTEIECVSFCLEQLKLPGTAQNQKDAAELGNILNFNPFSLQAATTVIIKKQKISAGKKYGIGDFIENYKNCVSQTVLKTQSLHESPGTGLQNLPMIDLWSATFQNIRKLKNGTLAIKITCFAAYLSTPCFNLTILSSLLPDVEKDDFEQALDILENYFVIEQANNSLSIDPIIRDIIKDTLKSDANYLNLLFQETFLNHAALLIELSTGLVKHLQARLKLDDISTKQHTYLVQNSLTLTNYLTELDSMVTIEFETVINLMDLICSISKSYALKVDYNKIIGIYGALKKKADTKHGPENTRSLTLKRKIGDVLMKQERYADAKEIYIKIFTAHKTLFGRVHEETLTTQACIADALHSLGDYAGALKMFCAVIIKQKERANFSCDPVALTIKLKVAMLLFENGEYTDALKLFERVLKDIKKTYRYSPGADDEFLLKTQTWIARVLVKQEKYDEAIELLLTLMDTSKNVRGPYHTETLLLKCDYATALCGKGSDHKTAQDMLESIFKHQKQTMSYTMLELAETENNLAHVLATLKDSKSATRMYAHILQVRSVYLGPEHPLTLSTEQAWGYTLFCENKFNKSAKVFRKVLNGRKKALGKYHPDTILTLQYLSQSLFEQGEFKMSVRFAEYLHELKIRKNFLVADHPKLVRSQQLLDLSIAKLPKRVRCVSKFPKPTPPPLLPVPAWIFDEAGNVSNIPACNPSVRRVKYGRIDGTLLLCCTSKRWTQTVAALQIMTCSLSFILNVFNLFPKVPLAYFIISLTSGSLLTLPGHDMDYFYGEYFKSFNSEAYYIFANLCDFWSFRATLAAFSIICAVFGSILYAGVHYEKQVLLLIWMIVKGFEIGFFGIITSYLVYPISQGNALAFMIFCNFLVCEAQKGACFYIVSRYRRELRVHLTRAREELLFI